MRKEIFVLLLVFSFVSLLSTVSADFTDPHPISGSYVFGRNEDTFSIIIHETYVDPSTAKLHIRVYESGSTLYNISLACYNTTPTDWLCNTTVPGFGSIASDGKTFIFYFDTNDTSGSYYKSGEFYVTIDRSAPEIVLVYPGEYTGGVVNIKFGVKDLYSGVNSSTVQYSFDNSTWHNTELKETYYTNAWDTTSLANNETVFIYAKAADLLGNLNTTRFNVTIDNEIPRMVVDSPYLNQTLHDTATFQVTMNDSYSGIDTGNIMYVIGNRTGALTCNVTNPNITTHLTSCFADFNTKLLSDNLYSLNFTGYDKAGNVILKTMTVISDNFPPSITFIYPPPNSQVWDTTFVNASIVDLGMGVGSASFQWQSAFNTSKIGNMTTMGFQDRNYFVLWNTREVSDGNYVLNINATDKLNHKSSNTMRVVVNNFEHPPNETSTTTSSISSITTTTAVTGVTAGTQTDTIVRKTVVENILKDPRYKYAFMATVVGISVAVLSVMYSKQKKKIRSPFTESLELDVNKLIENYKNSFDSVYNSILSSFKIVKLDELKDKVRVIIVYMEQLEKELLVKKIISVIMSSISEKNILLQFREYMDEQEEEIENLEKLKKSTLDRLYDLLTNILESADTENTYAYLNEAKAVCERLKILTNKEIDLLIKYLNRLDFLIKKG
jgi:hypothetical protein